MITKERPPFYEVVGRELWRLVAWLLVAVTGSLLVVSLTSELGANSLTLVTIPSVAAIGAMAVTVTIRALSWQGHLKAGRGTSYVTGIVLVLGLVLLSMFSTL